MALIPRFLNFVLNLIKRRRKSSFTFEEEFIGYEAFPSEYQDKLSENKKENTKFCGKS